jgi:pyridoxal phosphate-dependent aminotransferase EpsN
MNSKIFLSSPHMGGGEMKYITEAFEQNWIAPLGPNVNAFEKELAKTVGVKHAAALSSGTSAIHLALILLSNGQSHCLPGSCSGAG